MVDSMWDVYLTQDLSSEKKGFRMGGVKDKDSWGAILTFKENQ